MKVKVKKLYPAAILPTYATEGSACFDLYALTNGDADHGEPGTFRTGLAFEIPEGYVMKVYSRSGHGFKNDTRLANCVGIIDSDYRGELMVKLTCDKPGWGLAVSAGERIAQAMIEKVNQVQFEQVEELSETSRGQGGFGSTGK